MAKVQNPERLTRTQVRERGWSDEMIDRLMPEPDRFRPNPHSRKSPPMRLYDLDRVVRIEASVEYAAMVAGESKRRTAAKKAAETRRKREAEEAASDTPMTPEEIDRALREQTRQLLAALECDGVTDEMCKRAAALHRRVNRSLKTLDRENNN
jgi:hypothetical protein